MDVRDLPKGTKLNCILRHRSTSGMLRIIDLLTPDNKPIRIDGLQYNYVSKYGGGYSVEGCGGGTAQRLVCDLGLYLHNDSDYFGYKML